MIVDMDSYNIFMVSLLCVRNTIKSLVAWKWGQILLLKGQYFSDSNEGGRKHFRSCKNCGLSILSIVYIFLILLFFLLICHSDWPLFSVFSFFSALLQNFLWPAVSLWNVHVHVFFCLFVCFLRLFFRMAVSYHCMLVCTKLKYLCETSNAIYDSYIPWVENG